METVILGESVDMVLLALNAPADDHVEVHGHNTFDSTHSIRLAQSIALVDDRNNVHSWQPSAP